MRNRFIARHFDRAGNSLRRENLLFCHAGILARRALGPSNAALAARISLCALQQLSKPNRDAHLIRAQRARYHR
jgi:hypothetical protein